MKENHGLEKGVQEVIAYLRLTGEWPRVLQEIIQRKIIAQIARNSGLQVESKQLQRAADAFRLANELHSVRATKNWLRENHLTLDDLEDFLEANLLIDAYQGSQGEARSRKPEDSPYRGLGHISILVDDIQQGKTNPRRAALKIASRLTNKKA